MTQRAEYLIEKKGLTLLVLDIQGSLFEGMANRDRLLKNALKMIEFCKLLDIPVVLTEQYPQGLGPTLPQISEALPDVAPIAKTSFGCFGEPAFCDCLRELGTKTLLIVGMETHVCVMQTALKGLEMGYGMILVADAVSSVSEEANCLGFARMKEAGAVIANAEMAMFEILGRAKTDDFKKVFHLLKR